MTSEPTIDDAIVATEATLHSLEVTKVDLQLRYEECCHSLSLAHAQLGELRNRKAPISKLAMETLAMIFEAGLDDDFGSKEEILHHGLPFSVLVSQICGTWRRTAITHPLLWHIIRINISKPQHLFRMYVERSKSCAIDIQLTCSHALSTFDPSILHLRCCRRMHISCTFYRSVFQILISLQNKRAPQLTSFKLHVWSDPDHDLEGETDEVVHFLQGGAPKLTSVDLQSICIRFCWPPLNAILHLSVCSGASAMELLCCEFREVLAIAASSITDLVLDGVLIKFTDKDNFSQILLPNLLHLCFYYPDYFHEAEDEADYVARLAAILVAPQVQSLPVTSVERPPDVCHILRSLLPRRGTNTTLQSLRLQHVTLDIPTCDLLSACINIKEIFIDPSKPGNVNCVLHFMLNFKQGSQSYNPSFLWPHLLMLAIGSFDEELLRAVVLSRKAAGYLLTNLCLFYFYGDTHWYQEHVDEVGSWDLWHNAKLQ
jgi:hypothetical protein